MPIRHAKPLKLRAKACKSRASASSPGTVLALTRNSFGVAIGGGGIPIALLRREGMDAASALG